MPTDSTHTVQAILASAKREFLRHGFAGASLRAIAAGANVTTGALYRHFRDKDALFAALVEPVYTEFLQNYQKTGDEHLAQLRAEGIAALWSNTENSMQAYVDYMFEHYDAFKLLLSCSEQTPFEHFSHTLIEMDVRLTMEYIQLARKLGQPVRDLSRQELHLVINAQFACLYEMILHDVPLPEARRLTTSLAGFFTAGWRQIMME